MFSDAQAGKGISFVVSCSFFGREEAAVDVALFGMTFDPGDDGGVKSFGCCKLVVYLPQVSVRLESPRSSGIDVLPLKDAVGFAFVSH